jgi:hypothetical protein
MITSRTPIHENHDVGQDPGGPVAGGDRSETTRGGIAMSGEIDRESWLPWILAAFGAAWLAFVIYLVWR